MTVQNGDILRCDLKARMATSDTQIGVYHVEHTAGGPTAEADVLTDLLAVFTALVNLIRVIQSTSLVYDIVRVINRTQDSEVGNIAGILGIAGTSGADPFPLQVAYGLTLRTPSLRSQGRKFIGGGTEDGANTGGILGGGTLTNLANIGNYLIADQVVSGRTYKFGVPQVLTGNFLEFNGYSIPATAVTQRRRRKGIGV